MKVFKIYSYWYDDDDYEVNGIEDVQTAFLTHEEALDYIQHTPAEDFVIGDIISDKLDPDTDRRCIRYKNKEEYYENELVMELCISEESFLDEWQEEMIKRIGKEVKELYS